MCLCCKRTTTRQRSVPLILTLFCGFKYSIVNLWPRSWTLGRTQVLYPVASLVVSEGMGLAYARRLYGTCKTWSRRYCGCCCLSLRLYLYVLRRSIPVWWLIYLTYQVSPLSSTTRDTSTSLAENASITGPETSTAQCGVVLHHPPSSVGLLSHRESRQKTPSCCG